MTLKLFLKAAPYLAVVALLFVVLFQRNTITDRTAKAKAAEVQVAAVTDANKSLSKALEAVKQQRIDNDAIAEAVAIRIGSTQTRLVETRTIIEKAKANEPAVRAWGAVPVPVSVRQALRARADDAAPR